MCLSVCSKTKQHESTYARDFLCKLRENIPPLVTKHYFKCTHIECLSLKQRNNDAHAYKRTGIVSKQVVENQPSHHISALFLLQNTYQH